WAKPELRLSFALVDGKVICAPLETIVLKTKKYVTIAPGYKKSKAFAKEIRTKLFSLSSKDEQEILKEISVDYIQKFIPSGSGEILK
ncbi:MAG: hypothetical protein KAR23_05015, partial [Candidatus Aenigmarchaeota archaeon]|nr:hypothetical protein [Candidatus Aenigmarchaeota archaeon]